MVGIFEFVNHGEVATLTHAKYYRVDVGVGSLGQCIDFDFHGLVWWDGSVKGVLTHSQVKLFVEGSLKPFA